MIRHIASSILAIGMLTPVFAQEEALPKSIAGFFKPGMHCGITGSESGSFSVALYTESDVAIRADARNLSFTDLAAKYESVAVARDDTLKELGDTLGTGTPEFAVYTPPRERLCEIVHVGHDYILVQIDENKPYRMVYPLDKLTSIHWARAVTLQTTIRYPDRTK